MRKEDPILPDNPVESHSSLLPLAVSIPPIDPTDLRESANPAESGPSPNFMGARDPTEYCHHFLYTVPRIQYMTLLPLGRRQGVVSIERSRFHGNQIFDFHGCFPKFKVQASSANRGLQVESKYGEN